MMSTKTYASVLAWLSVALLITGLGVGFLFSAFDVPLAGLGGLCVAIILRLAWCILILAMLSRGVADSPAPQATAGVNCERTEAPSSASVWRAKLALYFAGSATLVAFALGLAGVPIAFIGFNFATGTNSVGLIVLLTGMVVGVIAFVGGSVAIVLGWMAANTSRNFKWLFAAIAMLFFQVIAYLLAAYIIRSF